jgi:DNA helicase-2/ATP-dependent DNA helicase PcrA
MGTSSAEPGAAAQIPQLEGDALAAVQHRGSHLQIIAAAGSGKTEVVSQRVVSLLADGEPARSIVAFTFTEKAAAELKHRITERVRQALGQEAVDQLGGLFVGTIHAYCFRLLQQRVPEYETYDVLDENQLNAFLGREATHLDLKALTGKLFTSIHEFLRGLDIVENELLEADVLDEPFRTIYLAYLDTLERYRLLTFGQQVARAVHALEDPAVASAVHGELRHLIVDEYQDVNPAQERLIRLLTGPGVELCVVGDDDQAIYQWRGSNVENITTFADRYDGVARFEILHNRRSVPGVVEPAGRFAATIPGRLEKQMLPVRADAGGTPVAVWVEESELDEAAMITAMVDDLHEAGLPYADIAVLVRGRVAYRKILDQFATFDIPVQPGGRTGLFDQPEAVLLGKVLCWLVDHEWRGAHGPGTEVDQADLLDGLEELLDAPRARRRAIREVLDEWKAQVPQETSSANLLRDFYELLDVLDVRSWDLSDPLLANRMGTLARFSALLADYEAVRTRARVDPDNPGEQVGAWDRGVWYYRNLAIYVVNHARGAYDGFDGEEDVTLDAVTVGTVHGAKGLEWPAVFVPSLTAKRFPNSNAGNRQSWPISRELFDADRYEGGNAEERRLFYVAMTRARDWFSASRHVRVAVKASAASPYWEHLAGDVGTVDAGTPDVPPIEPRSTPGSADLQVTFSEIASFLDCAMAYRLRNLFGFQPRLAPELGYGKAVHHVMRMVAEATKANGAVPTEAEIDDLLDERFYLPAANKAAHRQLKAAARRLVTSYATDHPDDLFRVWETERPFELHLDGVVVSGRADVVLDKEGGVETALAIVDYKTSVTKDADHALQIQVYADAGRREGLEVRGAYVHDLRASAAKDPGARAPVAIGPADVAKAESKVLEAANRIRAKDFAPSPGPKCRGCEVRTVCGSAI